MRTWTSSGGATIEASFVRWERGSVVLKKAGGGAVKIRPSDLSNVDQAWIKKNAPPPARDAGPTVVSNVVPNKLPYMGSGKWKGQHSVYEHHTFDATLDQDGKLHVYPKVDGERVRPPIWFIATCHYHDLEKGKYVDREIVSFLSPPAPALNAREIALKRLHEDDVRTQINIEFRDNAVLFGGHCKDPKNVKYPTRYDIRLHVPQVLRAVEKMKKMERRQFLSNYVLEIHRVEGAKDHYVFWKGISELGGLAKDARVIGPLYGERSIRVRAKSARKAPLRPWAYQSHAPWQGFVFFLQKNDKTSKSKSERIVLEFQKSTKVDSERITLELE
jgi:hypothetical protein